MIDACIGIPGSGKSFFAVHRALKYMAAGGAVFSNIRLHGVVDGAGAGCGLDRWELSPDSNVRKVLLREFNWIYQDGQYHYIDLETMDNDFLAAIPRGVSKEKRILLILDEVNEWFDSLDNGLLKDKTSKGEKYREMFKFLRLSRHYHIDVLFLLQDFSTLNARLRGLCASIWKSTDMQRMRVAGVPFRFPFPWFLWQQYDKTGKFMLYKQTWPKDQSIFSCYDSFCEFGAVGISSAVFNSDFTGKGIPKKEVKKMTKFDRLLLVVSVLVCCSVCWFGAGRGGPSADPARVVVVTNTVSLVSSPGAASGPAGEDRKELPRVTCEYAPLSFGESPYGKWCFAGGRRYEVGMRTENGLVVEIERYMIRCVSDDGREHFIYPLGSPVSAELAGVENERGPGR